MLDDLELAALMKRVQAGDADAYVVLLNDLMPACALTTHNKFIRRLVSNVPPVRPLPPPWMRVTAWCGVSLPVVGGSCWS